MRRGFEPCARFTRGGIALETENRYWSRPRVFRDWVWPTDPLNGPSCAGPRLDKTVIALSAYPNSSDGAAPHAVLR